ncbi:MAG: cobyric acid synthase [Crocinitomicaceae bacterium]|nr:cobyric acid synthase [Crocinitomicaceae bacterium]
MGKQRPIMLVGTGSDVGKSWIVTGICRWLKNNGYNPAPFKAQNMSLNSFATPTGHEIGRAQAVQAEACGISCSFEMNPILLKPSSQNKSQVVLNGKPVGSQTAREYFLGEDKKHLFEEAKKGFRQLDSQFSPIVMEGAGSISELNLKHRDIVNMRMAKAANACVYLVADIDRGGVFASVYGSIALLENWERDLMKGIIINKFRGDASLFEEGKKILEELTSLPVLGVLPFAKDIHIEEEDSVALGVRNKQPVEGEVNIAVVHLNYLSNYTDFQTFEHRKGVNLFYTRNAKYLEQADVIILPGTKNTIADLEALKLDGLDRVILSQFRKKTIIGICGGYQMMGSEISDPYQVESDLGTIEGLGIFNGKTVLSSEKQTVQTSFLFKEHSSLCQGYEIHMGETEIQANKSLNVVNGKQEGFFNGENCWGTYIHGIFDNDIVVKDLFESIGVSIEETESYKELKERNYDRLAEHIAEHIDMNAIIKDIEEC